MILHVMFLCINSRELFLRFVERTAKIEIKSFKTVPKKFEPDVCSIKFVLFTEVRTHCGSSSY